MEQPIQQFENFTKELNFQQQISQNRLLLWKKTVAANKTLQSQILEVEKREVDLKKRIEFLNETCKSQKLEAEEKTKLVSELQVKVKHLESLLEDDENDENEENEEQILRHVISSLLKQKKKKTKKKKKL